MHRQSKKPNHFHHSCKIPLKNLWWFFGCHCKQSGNTSSKNTKNQKAIFLSLHAGIPIFLLIPVWLLLVSLCIWSKDILSFEMWQSLCHWWFVWLWHCIDEEWCHCVVAWDPFKWLSAVDSGLKGWWRSLAGRMMMLKRRKGVLAIPNETNPEQKHQEAQTGKMPMCGVQWLKKVDFIFLLLVQINNSQDQDCKQMFLSKGVIVSFFSCPFLPIWLF